MVLLQCVCFCSTNTPPTRLLSKTKEQIGRRLLRLSPKRAGHRGAAAVEAAAAAYKCSPKKIEVKAFTEQPDDSAKFQPHYQPIMVSHNADQLRQTNGCGFFSAALEFVDSLRIFEASRLFLGQVSRAEPPRNTFKSREDI
jgi:hypothetical protein